MLLSVMHFANAEKKQSVQECDAREDNSSNVAWSKKIKSAAKSAN
jgi:hypothetical protein